VRVGRDKMVLMRPWPLLVALALACGPQSLNHPPIFESTMPIGAAERERVSACARSIVPYADVERVSWSRYRGRPALTVALSSPNDDVVDAFYGAGAGCDLLALVGRGPFDVEVQPGRPLRDLDEARRVARDGVVTSWALERDERSGRWSYRFDIDADGRMHTVFVDAVGATKTAG
jgi:hypothetical protein